MVRLNYTAPPKRPWWKHDFFQGILQIIGLVAATAPDHKIDKQPPIPLDEDEFNDPKLYGRYNGP